MFGPARDCAGGDTVTVAVELPAAVADVVAALTSHTRELADLLPCCAIAVGDELVAHDHVIQPGDEVGVLPPVSGGC